MRIEGKTLGERLRFARQLRKMTQEELGRGLFSKSFISQIEVGKTRPSIDSLQKLAKRLGVSVPELLGEDELHPAPTWLIGELEAVASELKASPTCRHCVRARARILRALGRAFEVAGELERASQAYSEAANTLLKEGN